MNITFTVDQVNGLLQELSKIPYVYAQPLIDGIKAIATPQIPTAVETPPEVTQEDNVA